MQGIQSLAFCPSTWAWVGTSRQPSSTSPSFSTMTSNIFFAWLRFSSSCGKKNIPTPKSRSPPSSMPSGFTAFEKNLCDTCSRIPTPSPVFPSASLPARCFRFSTIFNACSTVPWLLRPLTSTTAPIPQLSCSNAGSYIPFARTFASSTTCSLIQTSPFRFSITVQKFSLSQLSPPAVRHSFVYPLRLKRQVFLMLLIIYPKITGASIPRSAQNRLIVLKYGLILQNYLIVCEIFSLKIIYAHNSANWNKKKTKKIKSNCDVNFELCLIFRQKRAYPSYQRVCPLIHIKIQKITAKKRDRTINHSSKNSLSRILLYVRLYPGRPLRRAKALPHVAFARLFAPRPPFRTAELPLVDYNISPCYRRCASPIHRIFSPPEDPQHPPRSRAGFGPFTGFARHLPQAFSLHTKPSVQGQ